MWRVFLCLFLTGMSLHGLLAQGGGSLSFDGFDDWVNCGNDTLPVSNQLTVEGWLKATNTQSNSYARIFDKYNWYINEGFGIVLEAPTSGGSIMLDFFATDNSKNSVLGTKTINDNRWHYFAVTFDGDTVEIYVDGELNTVVSLGPKTIRPSSNFLGIGNNSDGAVWFPYQGQIDIIRFWNSALDSTTLRYWMFRPLDDNHPALANLQGRWCFDEGAGSIAHDSTANQYHGQLFSMDTTVAWQVSSAPIATGTTISLTDLSAVWNGKTQSNSSTLQLSGSSLASEDVILFGHDTGAVVLDSLDIPSNLGVQQRLQRIWQAEVYGAPQIDVTFDYRDLAISNPAELVLLVDEDGIFSNADTLRGSANLGDSSFTVEAVALQNGDYFTLATAEPPVGVNSAPPTGIITAPVLYPNYPNPFNPVTTIEFDLPAAAVVSLDIFDILGRQVETLYKASLPSGTYKFTWDATDAAGGVYFYRLQADGRTSAVKKMVLLK